MGRFKTLRATGVCRAGVVSAFSLAFSTFGCGAHDSGVAGAPSPPSLSPPSQPPPTGGKWQGVTTENECGRRSIEWIVVDEVCGDVTAPDYLDAFEAPMFRDGALVANLLYTVDAAHLWVLDMSNPSAIRRRALISGIGRPLAVATHAGRLVVAAGGEGLLLLGLEEPFEPRAIARVELNGPALDVHVDGDRAYVATGAAGVAVVDLSIDPPALVRELEVPGFAAGIKTKGGHAYVAACTTFAIVDSSDRCARGHEMARHRGSGRRPGCASQGRRNRGRDGLRRCWSLRRRGARCDEPCASRASRQLYGSERPRVLRERCARAG